MIALRSSNASLSSIGIAICASPACHLNAAIYIPVVHRFDLMAVFWFHFPFVLADC
jgi:hypothetical protein